MIVGIKEEDVVEKFNGICTNPTLDINYWQHFMNIDDGEIWKHCPLTSF